MSSQDPDALHRTLHVTVPQGELNAALTAKLTEMQPKVQLKGFRPGKAPMSHLRKMYGPSIMREVIDEKLQSSVDAAIAQAAVRPLGQPRFEVDSDMAAVMRAEADLAVRVELDVMPDFTPPDPSEITIEKPIAPVAEAQVEDTLAQLAAANRSFAETEAPAKDGDALVIDFVGRLDGEAFEGGSAEGAALVLGSGRFIPGFEDQLVGATAGESRTVTVVFPEDYPVARLQGKTAAFAVDVKAVRAAQEAVVDEDLAQRLGFETLEALRELVRARHEQEHAALTRAKMKRALFDKLDAALDFALPSAVVDGEFAEIWKELEAAREAGEMDAEDAAKSEDELRTSYRRIAERRVRLGLALAEIGTKNDIRIRDEDLAAAVEAQARRFPGQERQVVEAYRRNPEALARLRAPIYEERVVDYLLELVKTEERMVDRETLMAEDPPIAAPTPNP